MKVIDPEKAIVTQPGKADREFESPLQAFAYAASQPGPLKVYWRGIVVLSKGQPTSD